MKAIVCEQYGPADLLKVKDVKKPVPKENEVLIKIHAAAVTTGDWRIRSLTVPAGFWLITRLVFGLIKPRKPVLGMDLAGEVEAVGEQVASLIKGDRVFASSGMKFGAHAEYICVPENGSIATVPTGMGYEEAASILFGGFTALHFLRDKGKIQKGQKVLIYGASGSIGTAAVQLAKYFGAEVTGLCSTANLELVKSLGADKVIDYTKEDFRKSGETYDIVFETVGKGSINDCKGVLKKGGKLLLAVAGLPDFLQMFWSSMVGDKKVICSVSEENLEDQLFLKKLLETGELKPVIDQCYPMEQVVTAYHHVETGHKKGNVVLTMT